VRSPARQVKTIQALRPQLEVLRGMAQKPENLVGAKEPLAHSRVGCRCGSDDLVPQRELLW
jgi:hypothetical protein